MTSPACPICGATDSVPYPTPDPTSVRRCLSCGARWVWPAPEASRLRDRYEDEHERGEWSRRFQETPAEEWERRAALVAGLVQLGGGGSAAGRTAGGTDEGPAARWATPAARSAAPAARSAPPAALDVGCGDGRFLDALARRGWRTLGSEIALPGARLAAPRHAVVVGELDALARTPLFHAITYWDVLEHLPKPSGHVREAAHRLRPGGVLAISMPNPRGTASLVLGPRWPYYDFVRYGHLHHLAPLHLERLLAGAGLRPLHRETQGSVDLRDVPEAYGRARPSGAATFFLDRLSGALARIAEPLGRGNTTIVIGRKPHTQARGA